MKKLKFLVKNIICIIIATVFFNCTKPDTQQNTFGLQGFASEDFEFKSNTYISKQKTQLETLVVKTPLDSSATYYKWIARDTKNNPHLGLGYAPIF